MGRIVVTGVGVISAIGDSVAANRAALVEGKSGISKAPVYFNSRYSGILPFGEVPLSTGKLIDKLNAAEAGVTRTSLLALHAFNEAVADAGLSSMQINSHDTALITGNTVGGICQTDELYNDGNDDAEASAYLASYDFASVSLFLQYRYQMKGVVNTFNTACSSSANAIMYGCRLIKNGLAKRAIVGGTDSLSKFTVNGFNALRILSSELCMPFDENRSGLNLGEGAAFLILEKEEDTIGKKVYAVVSGYGNANDAFHPSSLSDDGTGPQLSMKLALAEAGLQPEDIGLVNAHGTGTENNDLVESHAMVTLFDTPPPFASTKSYTGHTLGAAGAVEAVYSILNLEHQEVYPNLHFQSPIAATALHPHTTYESRAVKHVMSNSFGFGGNCTTLIFSKA